MVYLSHYQPYILDLQTIYIYIYPYIPIYLHMYAEYIYIIHTPISLHMTYILSFYSVSDPTLQVEALMGLAWPDAMAEVTSAPFRRSGRWLGKCWDFLRKIPWLIGSWELYYLDYFGL